MPEFGQFHIYIDDIGPAVVLPDFPGKLMQYIALSHPALAGQNFDDVGAYIGLNPLKICLSGDKPGKYINHN
jgi:hypothetical protein